MNPGGSEIGPDTVIARGHQLASRMSPQNALDDPPPPYPSPERRSRAIRTSRRRLTASSDAQQPVHPHFPPSETTPLIHPAWRRHRANSYASTTSFTQTLLSFCHDSESEPDEDGQPRNERAWARYFRPMRRKAYHAALFHLMVLNFPYALIAWIYLFVFTLVSLGSLLSSNMRWWLMRRVF